MDPRERVRPHEATVGQRKWLRVHLVPDVRRCELWLELVQANLLLRGRDERESLEARLPSLTPLTRLPDLVIPTDHQVWILCSLQARNNCAGAGIPHHQLVVFPDGSQKATICAELHGRDPLLQPLQNAQRLLALVIPKNNWRLGQLLKDRADLPGGD